MCGDMSDARLRAEAVLAIGAGPWRYDTTGGLAVCASLLRMNDDRLTELELRYMVQHDLLQKLSDVVLQQGRDLERLRREVEALRGRMSEGPALMPADERPPHY